jgi:hypothetical protein
VPYRVLTGLSFPPDRRAEPGEIVDDIPSTSIKWLLAQGHIEEVAGGRGKAAAAPQPIDEDDD